jgi:predicted nucleic acid-binding protein
MINFFDTNVLLYVVGPSSLKSEHAKDLIGGGGVISVQVLNEFIHVSRRKLRMDFFEIETALEFFKSSLEVVPLSIDVQLTALAIARSTNFEIFDCNLIAAAELSNCSVLLTEDLNHGQQVGRVLLQNPFKAN